MSSDNSWSSSSTKVQQTNEDATLSKRSANKVGYFNDAMLKYFCRKLVNRTSLINRIYYYRVLAMRTLIDFFFQSYKKVQVLNIGCGFDTSVYVSAYRTKVDLRYIEMDLPDVISRKKSLLQKIVDEREVSGIDIGEMLANTAFISTDLSDIEQLRLLLQKNLNPDIPTLVLAECVLQYIPPDISTSILSEIGKVFRHSDNQAYLAIFDQIEPDDFFGRVMKRNLKKRSSELHGIDKLGSCPKQLKRLHAAGWEGRCSSFLNVIYKLRELNYMEAVRIDNLEPFDEHESFFETCCHYCLSIGFIGSSQQNTLQKFIGDLECSGRDDNTEKRIPRFLNGIIRDSTKIPSMRYSGYGHASVAYFSPTLESKVFTFGGFSSEGKRIKDLHLWDPHLEHNTKHWSGESPPARMYHTATTAFSVRVFTSVDNLLTSCVKPVDSPLKYDPIAENQFINTSVLVFGGRSAPHHVFGETNLFHCTAEEWQSVTVTESPCARYRHAATTIDVSIGHPIFLKKHEDKDFVALTDEIYAGSVFVFGGLAENGQCLGDLWMYCAVRAKWLAIHTHGESPKPRHNHAMCYDAVSMHVYISGGRSTSGQVLDDMHCLDLSTLCWSAVKTSPFSLQLFSHTMTFVAAFNAIIIVGGVSPKSGYWRSHGSVMVLDLHTKTISHCMAIPQVCGHQTAFFPDLGTLYVIGGGLQCFSFGSAYNESFSITLENLRQENIPRTVTIDCSKNSVSKSDWKDCLYKNRHPVHFKSMDLGECIHEWKNIDLLCNMEGRNQVIVHKLNQQNSVPEEKKIFRMDFIEKNFTYHTESFSDLMKDCFVKNTPTYFRSIARHDKKCDFWKNFPRMSKDFCLPDTFSDTVMDKDRYWQSCLRVSSTNVQLWTHYDIYDNILCQITGSKKVMLYPPSSYRDMKMSGSVSRIICPESDPVLQTRAIEVILQPGDVLFIPALWFHSIISLSPSIGINVFWKHLSSSEYTDNDNYGNHDLISMDEAKKKVIAYANDAILSVPPEYRMFTLHEIAESLART